eukprot:882953-Rhodomonas_salina.1
MRHAPLLASHTLTRMFVFCAVCGLCAVFLVLVCSQAAMLTNSSEAQSSDPLLLRTQQELVAAVKNQVRLSVLCDSLLLGNLAERSQHLTRYDEVLRLAAKAKQLKEYEQVAEEVMAHAPRPELYGYSAIQLFLVDVTSLCLGVGDDCDAAMSLRCCAVLRGAVMSDCVLLRVTSLSLSSLCCCETSAVTDMQTTRAADN